jgi:hypothetical protein
MFRRPSCGVALNLWVNDVLEKNPTDDHEIDVMKFLSFKQLSRNIEAFKVTLIE